mgnify:CR=1 FL=1
MVISPLEICRIEGSYRFYHEVDIHKYHEKNQLAVDYNVEHLFLPHTLFYPWNCIAEDKMIYRNHAENQNW